MIRYVEEEGTMRACMCTLPVDDPFLNHLFMSPNIKVGTVDFRPIFHFAFVS